jgi:hypothetical protein
MAKKNGNRSRPVAEPGNRMVELLENLFILNARVAGVKSDDIRALLAIDKARVNRVSKLLKTQRE